MTKFGAWHGAPTVVFNDMTVTLPTDQICAIMGRPGSGRTTFMRLLNGATRPESGRIVSDMRFSAISNLGAFFHAGLTGLENIGFAARVYGLNPTALTETVLEISRFGALWEISAGALPGPRRRAMEMLVSALLPYDCYLVDNVESSDPETFQTVLEILKMRQAGMIFTAKNPRIAQEFATIGSVIADRTVYAFESVDEALDNYG